MDKIVLYGYAIICGGLGIITTAYLVFSAVYTTACKFYRKVKFGISLYD